MGFGSELRTSVDGSALVQSDKSSASHSAVDFVGLAIPFEVGSRRLTFQLAYQRAVDLFGQGQAVLVDELPLTELGVDDPRTVGVSVAVVPTQRGALHNISASAALQVTERLYLGTTFNYWMGDWTASGTRDTVLFEPSSGPRSSSSLKDRELARIQTQFEQVQSLRGFNLNLGFLLKYKRVSVGGVLRLPFSGDYRLDEIDRSVFFEPSGSSSLPEFQGYGVTSRLEWPRGGGLGIAIRPFNGLTVTTLVNKLIGLQGLWVRGFHFQADKARVVVDVVPRRRKPLCGICGRKVRKNKDRYNRYWRHLDLFGVRTYLRYSIRRVVCRRCGVVREKVPWADKGSRFTKSFEQEVAWLAQRTDVSAVANYFRVTWRSVRRIIQRVVAEQRDERRELDGLRVIGMDEISYRKRHKYLTVVIDHLSGRVVWAGKERKAKTLLRFFRKLGPQRAAELEAVSMDMWEPYITVVGKKAPQARVIFDRFHIVKHLNEAVDKTRRELVRELKGTARRNLKNTKFPLLKAKHNRSAKDKRVLREQVRANRRLYRAMLLRDDFMDLYTYKTETWAKKFLRGWLRRAMSSRIEPVKRAAKMIRSHFDGVIAWVTWRLSNGRLEGMNNKIRLLSHRSFGLHSAEALISLVYLNCGGLTLERIH